MYLYTKTSQQERKALNDEKWKIKSFGLELAWWSAIIGATVILSPHLLLLIITQGQAFPCKCKLTVQALPVSMSLPWVGSEAIIFCNPPSFMLGNPPQEPWAHYLNGEEQPQESRVNSAWTANSRHSFITRQMSSFCMGWRQWGCVITRQQILDDLQWTAG